MSQQQVILVNDLDEPLGAMQKLEAHEKGLLHRAFSIFIFNRQGELLLQQRAMHKYHSGGLWSNTCCSHPAPGEETVDAALRRLNEEMGFTTKLEKIFDFVYKAEFDNGLSEHEFDHVFAGEYEGEIKFNKEEVMSSCYKPLTEIKRDLDKNPANYTRWFILSFPRMEQWWRQKYSL